MSKYLAERHRKLTPYTPGEQPRERKFIKLNTNESPFPPSKKAVEMASEAAKRLMLYSDPEAKELTVMMAKTLGVVEENVLMTNGSDEILNFAFMAFCDSEKGAAFPDITYGFYPVFAEINSLPYTEIPLTADFRIDPDDYVGIGKTVFIANPNAPTGILLSLDEIEKIISGNPENVVVIDEAYIDFGGKSAVSLTEKYKNLLVTGTFSKSRSMAGARLGFGVASKELILDLKLMKYSTNPYNVNSMTMAAGIGVLGDAEYTAGNCRTVIENREYTKEKLEELGFFVLPSAANFLFAKSNKTDGETLYKRLKEEGILVRHFGKEKIKDFCRITIGKKEDMETLVSTISKIIKE